MAGTVQVDLHRAEIYNFLYNPAGQVVRGVRRWSQQVRSLATARAPKDTGRLTSSSSVQMNTHPGLVVGVISFNARHALWVHEGTGIFGPRGRPIRARAGRVMRFPTGAGGRARRRGGFTYTREARGQRPRRYLVSALRLIMVSKGAKIRTFRVR